MQSGHRWSFLTKTAVLVLGLCGTAIARRGPLAADGPQVDLYVLDHANVDLPVLNRATAQAWELLAGVGVPAPHLP